VGVREHKSRALLVRGKGNMTQKKHRVEFKAHKVVREEVPVRFRTRDGERVSFEAKKDVKEPVKVKFMARGE
jgi:hypothetical protein